VVGVIQFPPPAKLMNLNDRAHWSVKARATKVWREAAYYAAIQAKVKGLGPSEVTIGLPVRTAHQRDPSNLIPTCKAIVDGLVDAGVWPDDNSEWVTVHEPVLMKGGFVLVQIKPRLAALLKETERDGDS
jgi:crossover junction endodeoxyribonuclease RusA